MLEDDNNYTNIQFDNNNRLSSVDTSQHKMIKCAQRLKKRIKATVSGTHLIIYHYGDVIDKLTYLCMFVI